LNIFSTTQWIKPSICLVTIVYLLLPILAIAENDRDFHISFGAGLKSPSDDRLSSAPEFTFQLASSVKAMQVGLEGSYQHKVSSNYKYAVPYNQETDKRNLRIYSGFLVLRISPWHLGYVTPYLGGFFGGSYVLEKSVDSPYFEDDLSEDKVLLAGPTLGLEILPNGFFSLFLEAKKSFQVVGNLQRSLITSSDQFGNVVKTTENYDLNAMSFNAGFRLNF